jgi:hypothetical protein
LFVHGFYCISYAIVCFCYSETEVDSCFYDWEFSSEVYDSSIVLNVCIDFISFGDGFLSFIYNGSTGFKKIGFEFSVAVEEIGSV